MKRLFCNCLCLRVILLMLLLASVAQARIIGKGLYVSQEFPPRKPDPLPLFSMPRERETLDDGWQFVQTILDADTHYATYPSYLNAVPAGMGFSHQGRGFLATLHTIFTTSNGGYTWVNLDNAPPPSPGFSNLAALRSPTFIGSISVRPMKRESVILDSLFISTIHSALDTGTIRTIYYASGSYRLFSLPEFRASDWLNLIAVVDSVTACAFAGLDGKLYRNDHLWASTGWAYLNPDKVLIHAGRQDSSEFTDTWVTGVTSVDSLIIAVGSHHWISRDRGARWVIRPAADSLFDNAVSFADTVYGMTAGGTISPELQGWVHRTINGGRTWSGRVLMSSLPMRAVEVVTPAIAFVAGGSFDDAEGEMWMTTDSGRTWTRDLSVSAELRVLESRRFNAAYVDVFAAGVFPDFRGGVWRKRLYLPIADGAVIVADTDTIFFGDLAAGIADTMAVTLSNEGTLPDTLTSIQADTSIARDTTFLPVWPPDTVAIEPGASMDVNVVFRGNILQEYFAAFRIVTKHSGDIVVICNARVTLDAEAPRNINFPNDAHLTVWPNPGNATFDIRFDLLRAAVACVRVYDLSGRLVETLAQASFAPGEFSRTWDASNRATGIYFVRLDADGSQSVTQKVLLVK